MNLDVWEVIDLYGPDSQIQEKHLNRNRAKEALTITRLMLVLLNVKTIIPPDLTKMYFSPYNLGVL